MRKTRTFQIVLNDLFIVIAMGRSRQKAGRIIRKKFCQSICYIIGKYIIFDAIPYIE